MPVSISGDTIPNQQPPVVSAGEVTFTQHDASGGKSSPMIGAAAVPGEQAGSDAVDVTFTKQHRPAEGFTRIDLYHARFLANSKEEGQPLLSSLQRSCMENYVVGGVWPQTRLYAAGYAVDQKCPLCRLA